MAAIDQHYDRNCLIVADLSNDPTYAETLSDSSAPRHRRANRSSTVMARLGRRGASERRILVYHVGRTFLFDHLLAELRDQRVRFAPTPECHAGLSSS